MSDNTGSPWPSSVKIGGKKYEIAYISDFTDDEYGDYDPRKQLIRIDIDLPPEEKVETLLHEILHACANFAGISIQNENERLTEEQFVTRLSPILFTVLVENDLSFLFRRYE